MFYYSLVNVRRTSVSTTGNEVRGGMQASARGYAYDRDDDHLAAGR